MIYSSNKNDPDDARAVFLFSATVNSVSALHEGEDEALRRYYSQEHGQRVNRGVGYGRCVVTGGVVGVGKGRGIGIAA